MAEQIVAQSGQCLHVTAWDFQQSVTMAQLTLPQLICRQIAEADDIDLTNDDAFELADILRAG